MATPGEVSSAERERAVLEVERRREAASQRNLTDLLTDFDPDKFSKLLDSDDIKESDPKVFLANIIHRGTRPRSMVPAVRFIGAFQTAEQALNFARTEVYPKYPHCDIRLGFFNEWIPILASNDKLNDKEFTDAKVKTLLGQYFDMLKKHQDEFLQNIQEKKTGKTGQSSQAKRDKAHKKEQSTRKKALEAQAKAEAASDPSKLAEAFVPPYPQSLMIPGQTHMAVAFVLDEDPAVIKGRKDSEPMFMALRVYDDEGKGKEDVKEDLSLQIREFSIDVVDMYQFLYPDSVNQTEIDTEYRDPELNKIMKAKREEPKNVQKFKKLMKQKKKEIKEIEITPENKDLPEGSKVETPKLDITTQVRYTKDSEWQPAEQK